MTSFKKIALAVTAALSLTAVSASAQGYGTGGYNAPIPAWTSAVTGPIYAPGTGYTHTNVNYHGHGNQGGHGNGYGNQGHQGVTYYRVHGVSYHDHLNVRHGPGVRNHVVYHLPYNAHNIQVGNCTQISTSRGPSTWCVVHYQGHTRGWVNARYLAQQH